MRLHFKSLAASLTALGLLGSCALITKTPSASATKRSHGHAITFQAGEFLPDRRPLKPEDNRDLREMALSLPIWDSKSEESVRWVYQNSFPALKTNTWRTPTDGGQLPIQVKRLPDSWTGAQRIELWTPPSMAERSPRDRGWTFILKRKKGGWLVERGANKKE
ncbi:hypothetical protein [Luteolibacter soli]|uniref:Lipoprotein n=1 Tax=Luteolibacter soli TaxID=3135280 RepID=A0ABU9B328_9BACT